MSEIRPDKQPLRFGVMCAGTRFHAWEANCLRALLTLENVTPALLIIDDSMANHGALLRDLKKLRNVSRLFWYIFNAVDRSVSRAMKGVSMGDELAGVPEVRCRVLRKGKFSEYFREGDLTEIRKHDLDFILRFGFNIIRGEILDVPRYGVWSFHHGDEERYRGSAPCFWELYTGDHVTGAILQRLTDRLDAGIVLKKGFFKTNKTSYTKSRDRVFFDSAGWPAQVCIDIQNGRDAYLSDPPSRTQAPIYRAPHNGQMLLYPLKIMRNILADVSRKLFLADKWKIGVVSEPLAAFVGGIEGPAVRWLAPPPRNRFYADPFAIRVNKDLHILMEEYDYTTSKGVISAMRIAGSESSPPEVVLDKPVHLSHPYLLEHAGTIYCLPEMCDAKKVVLYRVDDFPAKWTETATLIENFAGVDSTIVEYDDWWWLFATDQEDGPNHKLWLWFSRDLMGPWRPHPRNPVKMDVRSARPAGTPFIHGGTLIRPAQDCSDFYGKRITLNRILKLSPDEFEEEHAGMIEPSSLDQHLDGIHTVSAVGDVTVIDGMKKVFVGRHPSMIVHKLKKALNRDTH